MPMYLKPRDYEMIGAWNAEKARMQRAGRAPLTALGGLGGAIAGGMAGHQTGHTLAGMGLGTLAGLGTGYAAARGLENRRMRQEPM